jgi:hypothetical protein
MFAHPQFIGLCAMVAVGLPSMRSTTARYTLAAEGAVQLTVTSADARYGIATPGVDGQPFYSLSLGATSDQAALTLSRNAAELPAPGRYEVKTWEEQSADGTSMQAAFVAGTPGHPIGAFHGESGSVTITEAQSGRISGEFEIRARGFLADAVEDEDQWVTVRGTFYAIGDSSIVLVQSATVSASW